MTFSVHVLFLQILSGFSLFLFLLLHDSLLSDEFFKFRSEMESRNTEYLGVYLLHVVRIWMWILVTVSEFIYRGYGDPFSLAGWKVGKAELLPGSSLLPWYPILYMAMALDKRTGCTVEQATLGAMKKPYSLSMVENLERQWISLPGGTQAREPCGGIPTCSWAKWPFTLLSTKTFWNYENLSQLMWF